MEFKCNICDRDFATEESLNQHNLSKHSRQKTKKPINKRKYLILSIVVVILILSTLTVFSYMKKPGQYNEFAQCLTDSGAVMYGNDFCSYTAKQINFFGKSKQYLNYVKCIKNKALCNSKGITITPTWEIDGQMYEQVQTFEILSTLTGCVI